MIKPFSVPVSLNEIVIQLQYLSFNTLPSRLSDPPNIITAANDATASFIRKVNSALEIPIFNNLWVFPWSPHKRDTLVLHRPLLLDKITGWSVCPGAILVHAVEIILFSSFLCSMSISENKTQWLLSPTASHIPCPSHIIQVFFGLCWPLRASQRQGSGQSSVKIYSNNLESLLFILTLIPTNNTSSAMITHTALFHNMQDTCISIYVHIICVIYLPF